MTWASAISDGFRRSFVSSGRTSRASFWKFATVGILPPTLFASQVSWTEVEIWGIWKLGVLALLSLPLLNAAARRLQDSGEDSSGVLLPFAPFFLLWTGYQLILWAGVGIGVAGGFGFTFLLWILALIILVPAHLFALFISLMAISNMTGQMLVSSQPGNNKYGPNPHEVTT